MSQILSVPLGMDWFRNANKYIENLYQISTTEYGTVTVKRQKEDESFQDEFDYIITNMGL